MLDIPIDRNARRDEWKKKNDPCIFYDVPYFKGNVDIEHPDIA